MLSLISYFCAPKNTDYIDTTNSMKNLDLNTGDIILFDNSAFMSQIVEKCTGSKYSHIGIVISDCTLINKDLKGTYVLESTLDFIPDAVDKQIKFGVTLHSIEDVIKREISNNENMYVRKLCNFEVTDDVNKKIKQLYDITKDVPYETNPVDWLQAKLAADSSSVMSFVRSHHIPIKETQEINRLWCSALVGYFYVELGILDKSTPFELLSPRSFSEEKEDLMFLGDYCLSKTKKVV